jgi:hypothetical protein
MTTLPLGVDDLMHELDDERDSVLARWSSLGPPVRDDGPDAVVVDPSGNALALVVQLPA